MVKEEWVLVAPAAKLKSVVRCNGFLAGIIGPAADYLGGTESG